MEEAARRRGYEVTRLPYHPDQLPTRRTRDVVYGGVMWAETIATQMGITLHETPLDWLAHRDPSLTGRHVTLTTVREVWDNPTLRPHATSFYKPLDGQTPPPGRYNGTEMPGEPDTVLMRQGVLDITMEVRTFVLDGEVRASSVYAMSGDPFITPVPEGPHLSAIRSLVRIAAVTSAPATVMDFALTTEDRWVVLEQNAPWCSSLYACDPDAAFDVVVRSQNQGNEFVRTPIELDFHDPML